MGSIVILDNVHNHLSPLVHPIIQMKKMTKVVGRDNEIIIANKSCPISFDFEMVITSAIGNPDFGAEISENLILVNFELSEVSFESQIMSILIQEIDRDLDEEQRKMRSAAREWIHEVKETELRILDLLDSYKDDAYLMLSNDNLRE